MDMNVSARTAAFLSSLASPNVTISHADVTTALTNLVGGHGGDIGSTPYTFTGHVSSEGGSLSLTAKNVEGSLGSVKFDIKGGALDIFQINTTTIYSGQGVFMLLFTAVGLYAQTHGATNITSTDITNSTLWHKLVVTKQISTIAALLHSYATFTLPRSIKPNQ